MATTIETLTKAVERARAIQQGVSEIAVAEAERRAAEEAARALVREQQQAERPA